MISDLDGSRLGPDIFSTLRMKGHVLHCVRARLEANVIYCITCTLCKKLYIGETGRGLGDRF